MQWDLLSWKNLGSSTFPPVMWECVLVFLRIALLIPPPHRLTRWVTMVCCPEWGLGNRRRLMHLVVGVSWAWPLRWSPGSLSGHCQQGLCSNHCPVLPVRHRQQIAIPSQQLFLPLSLLFLSLPLPFSFSSSSFCSSSSLLLSFLDCFRCLANLRSSRVCRGMWSAYQAHIIK